MPKQRRHPPETPARTLSRIRESADRLVVEVGRQKGMGLFMPLWLLGWTVGCVMLSGIFIQQPSVWSFFLCLPFWAGWLVGVAMTVLVWGRETILIKSDEFVFVRRAIVKSFTQAISIDEATKFEECSSTYFENYGMLRSGIELQCQGKPVQFGFYLPGRERLWLLHYLNTQLAQRSTTDSPDGVSAAAVAAQRLGSDDKELTYKYSVAEASSNSTWRVVNTDDDRSTSRTLRIRQRGRCQFARLTRQLIPTIFWNGVVSMMFLGVFGFTDDEPAVRGSELWQFLAFMFPFAVIGLLMLGSLVATVLEPFRATTWRIDSRQVECETRYWFYRRCQQWASTSIARLMQREDSGEKLAWLRQFDPRSLRLLSSSPPYSITFVNTDNIDVCTIENMTEDETRSIARLIFDRTDVVARS